MFPFVNRTFILYLDFLKPLW